MKLMTKEIRKSLPPLYSTDGQGDEVIVRAKYFTPDSNWTWYATEFDGDDTFFGLINGFAAELGLFSLKKLDSIRGPMGLPIERDRYFTPKTLGEVKAAA